MTRPAAPADADPSAAGSPPEDDARRGATSVRPQGRGRGLRGLLAAARRRLGGGLRRVVRAWRGNLQVRVVAATMLLGLLVILAVQAFLYQRTSEGLLDARMVTAREDAAQRSRDMQARLDATDQIDPDSVRQFTYDLVRQQESQGVDSSREVILTRAVDNVRGPERIPTMWTDGDVGLDVVPAELRRALAADPQHQQVQVVTVPHAGRDIPAVIVGSRILVPQAGQQELYFVYPLEREDAIMTMMLRTFALGALVLVGLIGLVAYVVTRLVVDPVREAAAVAGRLSSGRLDERMHTKGSDELARLAQSFNDMADSLQTQIRRLEDLSRLQQRFVSDVSHELRTPLTTIRMASEVIHDARADMPMPVARSTELLYTEVDRFDALLAELLEISRFDAGGAVLDLAEVDMRDVVDRVVDAAAPLAAAKGSTVTVYAQARPYPCDMDPRRVERILRNLVVNALEHGEGRPVDIEIADDEHAVGVAVRDHGVGLEPGQAALVFNRFWRADPARNRTTGGTGLGLAIALEDARLHSGWLQAWGRPGAGARFRLTLPRHAGGAIESAPLPLGPDPRLPLGRGELLRPRAGALLGPAGSAATPAIGPDDGGDGADGGAGGEGSEGPGEPGP